MFDCFLSVRIKGGHISAAENEAASLHSFGAAIIFNFKHSKVTNVWKLRIIYYRVLTFFCQGGLGEFYFLQEF